jgi:hypothetical protein
LRLYDLRKIMFFHPEHSEGSRIFKMLRSFTSFMLTEKDSFSRASKVRSAMGSLIIPLPPFDKGGNYTELLLKSPFEKGGFRGI